MLLTAFVVLVPLASAVSLTNLLLALIILDYIATMEEEQQEKRRQHEIDGNSSSGSTKEAAD